MLWLHLFANADKCRALVSLFTIGDLPLAFYLTRVGNTCVSMFVFLSGYGLWVVFSRGKGMHLGRRVLSLYVLVTIVGVLFFPWHSLANPSLHWHFDAASIVSNLTGYDTFNAEWWFLMPYTLVMLISPLLFNCLKRKFVLAAIIALTVALLATVTFVVLLKCVWGNELYTTYRAIEMALLVAEFLMPFTLGAISAKTGLLKWFSEAPLKYRAPLYAATLAALLVQMCIDVNVLNGSIALPLCFVAVSFRSKFLKEIGEVSGEMWLCHTFFCIYYFGNLFVALRYPIVMYIVLLTVSFLCGHVIRWLHGQTMKFLYSRKV